MSVKKWYRYIDTRREGLCLAKKKRLQNDEEKNYKRVKNKNLFKWGEN